MKIKRFLAKDMRSALAQVKETLGLDAVIMSNKKVTGGIEIVAAVDYDESKTTKASTPSLTDSTGEHTVPVKTRKKGYFQGLSSLAEEKVSLGQQERRAQAAPLQAQVHKVAAAAEWEKVSGLNLKEKAAQLALIKAKQEQINSQTMTPLRREGQPQKGAVADSLQALLERQQNRVPQQIDLQKTELQKTSTQADNSSMPEWAKSLQEQNGAYQHQKAEFTPKASAQSVRNKSAHQDEELAALKRELVSIRSLLTDQVSSLMSDKKQRTDPVGAMFENKLLQAEFSPLVAKKLSGLSEQYSPAELVKTLPQSLANLLDNQGDDIVRQGGVVAFVGPTGVGKTTTIAKLAARYASYHGSEHVGLITTDHYRIGAFEQLATYGKIMGCPVRQVHDINELEQVLYQFRNRKLILIDTAGMGQRDLRLFQQLDNLTANSRLPIRNYLVMAATGQRKVLEEAVAQFARIALSGVVLTKLDESTSLAPALSVLIESGLPLSYVTDGQRVPEDMQVADTLDLANSALSVLDAVEPIQNSQGSDDLIYAVE
ncbi:flagellar biosynthesis protein FlhF [Shewanella surugensis]|uniref:Flagellar biosynthesis protein FlhF n=1 Tax=Shewanella surugensis TaxID=212020 RepID=A0ABT0L831_9GAMM|nr:flagellar biosynthesis protein FlhF [Shewanella surugensis]MCL1123856.1 flagellar biosynthesis protein FlhF [Shewanella surugensis]